MSKSLSRSLRQTFRGTASQVAVGCVIAVAVVAMIEASVVYDEECGRGPRGWDSHFSTDLLGENRFVIRHGGCRLEARLRGDVEFSADERGLRRLDPGAYLEIRERKHGVRRRLEVRPGADGEPVYAWFVDRRAAEFDAQARTWLQAALREIFRASGLDAEGRVGRLLAAGGLAAVFAEVPEISADHVRARYLEQTLAQAEMESAGLEEWLRIAGRHVGSDFELGRLLALVPAASLDSGAARSAYAAAVRAIGSDFELRRCLTALIDGGGLPPAVLDPVLEAATTIGSDFELAELLVEVARSSGGDPPEAFFEVLAGVGSDFEHRRVLEAVVERPRLEAATIRRVLESSRSIGSDFEQARLLAALAAAHPIADDLRLRFEEALAGVGSDFERGRVRAELAD